MKVAIEGIACSGAQELAQSITIELGWKLLPSLSNEEIINTFIEANKDCFVSIVDILQKRICTPTTEDCVCYLSQNCLVNVYTRAAFNNQLLDELQWSLVKELFAEVKSEADIVVHVLDTPEECALRVAGQHDTTNVLIGLKGIDFQLRRFMKDNNKEALEVSGHDNAVRDLIIQQIRFWQANKSN